MRQSPGVEVVGFAAFVRRQIFEWPLPSSRKARSSVGNRLMHLPKMLLFSGNLAGQKEIVEKLVDDPSQWRDGGPDKVSARNPDFKHKKASASLWIDSKLSTSGVRTNLAAIRPVTVQSSVIAWNKRLAMYAKMRKYDEILKDFRQMQQEGVNPDKFTFLPVLTACACLRALEEGRRIHAHIVSSSCELDLYICTSLVTMYAKCGSIEDAWRVFNNMSTRNAVAWNAMILGLVKCGHGKKALELSRQMQREGLEPDSVSFVGMLNACASEMALEEGKRVHDMIVQKGFESHVFVGSSLVDMYVKCGSIEDARTVFNKIPRCSVVAWSIMIFGYVRYGEGLKALQLYQQMVQEALEPNAHTFVGVLNACAIIPALEEGRHIHEQILKKGYEADAFVGHNLIDMYLKCGSMVDAERVFNKIGARNSPAWNTLIQGYARCGQGQKVLELYHKMKREGIDPNLHTLVGVLNACASVAALEEGKSIHEQIIKRRWESDIFMGSSLVDMYIKCGSIESAWSVFNKMPKRNVVCWSAIILGYVKLGQGQRALELYRQMQEDGVPADPICFAGFVSACATTAELEVGMKIHEQITQKGYEADVFVSNSLIGMYAKCGRMDEARNIFNRMPKRSVVAWSMMIGAYVKCGQGQEAVELSRQMLAEGVEPNPMTFVAMLSACSSELALQDGRRVHEHIILRGHESDTFVHSCLIDMYVKCGSIEDAWIVFSKVPKPSVFSWSAMILGYVRCGQAPKALHLSRQMQQMEVEANVHTFVGILNACASLSALEEGKRVHDRIIQCGCESDVFVANSLVDMYAKCGSLEDAQRVFDKMSTRDVVSWNVILGGYAMHGAAHSALELFQQMSQEGVAMDKVTFVSLLSACSHAGLVDEGLHYLEYMTSVCNISPTAEHYTCLVDLLGRAGRLHEAEEVIETVLEPNTTLWMPLLGACRIHSNLELGERTAKLILDSDGGNDACYVLLSNLYSAAGKWERSAKVKSQRSTRGLTKQPGLTWIEVNNEIHSFSAGHQEHPRIKEITAELERLSVEIKEAGYVPDVSFVLHNVDKEEKEAQLSYHSEKLAIAFGLISTPPDTPIRIFKNLRVCGDCHTATKFIGKVVRRPIIVRDARRFHHFENGVCSCGDYW